METLTRSRIVRSDDEITSLLDDYEKSNLSVKEFCELSDISEATYYNWRNRFRKNDKKHDAPGFAKLQVTQEPIAESQLFAEVNGIRLYQAVSASYLKELVS
jgi:transposase-like protein